MSAVSSLGSNLGVDQSSNAFSSLTSEEFVKIMFTELSRQDPLQPNDSKAMLEQLSSLRNIQSDIDLSNKLNSLVTQNEMASASALIGKRVSGISENNRREEGEVTSVIRTSEGPVLRLGENVYIRMSNMDQVLLPPSSTGGTQTTNTTNTSTQNSGSGQ
jgi:flagellar basal-body rod modification protein FlgD